MGTFLVKLRQALKNGKHYLLTPEREAFLYSELPDFEVNRGDNHKWKIFTDQVDAIALRIQNGLGMPK